MDIIRNAFLQDLEDYTEEISYIISKANNIIEEDINTIFRIVHSIKASLGILGYKKIADLINTSEDIIKLIKTRKIDKSIKEIIFKTQDIISILKNFITENINENLLLIQIKNKMNEMEEIVKTRPNILLLTFSPEIMKICDPLSYIKILKKNFNLEIIPIKNIPLISELNPIDYYIKWKIISKEKIEKNEIEKVFEFLDKEYYNIESLDVKESKKIKKDIKEEKKEITTKSESLRVSSKDLDLLLDILNEIASTFSHIKRLTNDENIIGIIENSETNLTFFQNLLTKIRLVSLEPLLYKFYKVVDEYSKTAGKLINLKINADISVDKSIFDAIESPINHLIRNAIDHGIEYSEERIKKGKEETGNIEITCSSIENEIVISVKDDGQGIDIQKIEEKAKKLGIKYKKEDVINIIFEPGFTTKDTKTEYSGMGFGLDIVKENLKKIRGSIEVKTEKDKGTEFIIKVPISLFIANSIIFSIGSQKYAIPINYVKKIIKYDKIKRIEKFEGKIDMVKLEDRYYPVVYFDKIFKNIRYQSVIDRSKAYFLLFELEESFMIFVDKVIGQESLFIKNTPGISKIEESITGISIFGGETIFILDIFSVYKKAKTSYNFYNINNLETFII